VPLRCNNVKNTNNDNQEATFDNGNFNSIKKQENLYDYNNSNLMLLAYASSTEQKTM